MDKMSKLVQNTLVGVSEASWVDGYSKGNRPTHQGGLVLEFSDGSTIKVPTSTWYNASPEGRRPHISTVLNKWKFCNDMERAEELAGDCLFDNPLLRDRKELRDQDEHANRDSVHDAKTDAKITRKARAKKTA